MADETFYFIFSLVFVLIAMFYLVNIVLLRTKGKTTFGLTVKLGSPEYKRSLEFVNKRNIGITIAATLILAANLVYCVNRAIHLGESKFPHGLLIWLTVSVILAFALLSPIARRQARIVREMNEAGKRK